MSRARAQVHKIPVRQAWVQVVFGLADMLVIFGLVLVGAISLFGPVWGIALVVGLFAANAAAAMLFLD